MPDTTNTTGSDNQPRGGQGFPQENRDGSPTLVGPDEYTKAIQMERLNRGHTTVVGGNFADLQRLGEQIAGGKGTSTSVASAIAPPPGLDVKDDNVVTAPQNEAARGEWTRETERVGLLDAPLAPEPAENKDPTPVDPGNQSPTVATKGDTAPAPRKS